MNAGVKDCLAELSRLCISYAGLALQFPDMFPQPERVKKVGVDPFVSRLLAPVDSSGSLATGFLDDFVTRFDGDGLDELVSAIALSLAAAMRKQTINHAFTSPLNALYILCGYKPIVAIVSNCKILI
jgi:hypothetical protein